MSDLAESSPLPYRVAALQFEPRLFAKEANLAALKGQAPLVEGAGGEPGTGIQLRLQIVGLVAALALADTQAIAVEAGAGVIGVQPQAVAAQAMLLSVVSPSIKPALNCSNCGSSASGAKVSRPPALRSSELPGKPRRCR